jgi:hypothetical protein
MMTGKDDLANIFKNNALTLKDLLFIKGKLSLDYNLLSIPTAAPPKLELWSGWPVLAHTTPVDVSCYEASPHGPNIYKDTKP